MFRFLLRRLLQMLPLLIGISFIVCRAASCSRRLPDLYQPGPFHLGGIAGAGAGTVRPGISPGWCSIFSGWAMQYEGISATRWAYHVPVAQLIYQRLFNTLLLSFSSLAVSWGLGIPLGILAGVRRNSWLDRAVSLFAFAGISFPGFFLALLMLMLAQKTGWFPVGQMHTQGASYEFMSPWEQKDGCGQTSPSSYAGAGVPGCAGIMRQMRGSLLDTLREELYHCGQSAGPVGVQGRAETRRPQRQSIR